MNRLVKQVYFVLLLLSTQYTSVVTVVPPLVDTVNIVEIEGRKAVFVNSGLYDANSTEEVTEWVDKGAPVVFYGDQPKLLLDAYIPQINVEDLHKGDSSLLVFGVITNSGNRFNDSVLRVTGRTFTEEVLEHAYNWIENHLVETVDDNLSNKYGSVWSLREIEMHEPYGVIESTVEIVHVLDSGSEIYDWYDITVTQNISPGKHLGDSDWGWSWLEYKMNGTEHGSNVYLTDYDQPPAGEKPIGLFSFLWKILSFRWDEVLPWLREKPVVQGLDMSDFSVELFMTRYENSGDVGKPFTVRHHYVVRVEKGQTLMFWHQTQIKYVKGLTFNVERHVTPPVLDGLVIINP